MAGAAVGLDFAAVMMVAAAQDADLALVADVLPEFEAIVVANLADDAPQPEDEEFS